MAESSFFILHIFLLICELMERFEKDALYELLRIALDDERSPCSFSHKLIAESWDNLHTECAKQLVTGVVYRAICRLPHDLQPPHKIVLRWALEAETIKGQNKLLNAEAARLTELFAVQGCKTAVLKGPANALLYPDPYMRQVGDIDLWVDGGRDHVFAILKKLGYKIHEWDLNAPHHVHLDPEENGIPVEVHYRPSFGTWNPFASSRLMCFLEKEIRNVERSCEGFYVPSIKFALAMQLAHIHVHFIRDGVGLKQILDYCMLLKHSSEDDRCEIAKELSNFGLLKVCKALMWIMGYVFELDEYMMLCKPDEKLGRKMLSLIQKGGNFGIYATDSLNEFSRNFVVRFLKHRWRNLHVFWFAPVDVLMCELEYWKRFARSISVRIKLRRLSLWDLSHSKFVKKVAR